MGLSVSLDIFQWIMNSVLGDILFVIVYLDNILLLSTFDDHLDKIDTILEQLHCKKFKVNLYKLEMLKQQLNYLGYTLTLNSIKPQTKKIEAIMQIVPPRNKWHLQHFLGMVNYYCNM